MDYITILSNWNFWEKKIDTGRERPKYLSHLMKLEKLSEAVVLSGVRRSGKSTILLQFLDHLHKKNGVPPRNTLYVNFEDPQLGESLTGNDLFAIFDVYKSKLKPKGKIYLCLDEVQHVSGWERFVRVLIDQKQAVKVFVTGSTSTLLESKASTSLTGRAVGVSVHPLDYEEFLQFKKVKKPNTGQYIDEYLYFGGFPKVVLTESESTKRELLVSYYETILERDVILRNNIKNKREIKQLARFVLSNDGSLISSYALEKTMKISSENINRYLGFFEEAFVIFRVPFFSYSVKQQIYRPDKIFCVDTGLVNVAGFVFSQNKGRLLENLIYHRLRASEGQVFYWKNGTEIDFVRFSGQKVRDLINVTLTVDDPDVLDRELKSLEIGRKEFPEANMALLTLYNQSKQADPRIYSLEKILQGEKNT